MTDDSFFGIEEMNRSMIASELPAWAGLVPSLADKVDCC